MLPLRNLARLRDAQRTQDVRNRYTMNELERLASIKELLLDGWNECVQEGDNKNAKIYSKHIERINKDMFRKYSWTEGYPRTKHSKDLP